MFAFLLSYVFVVVRTCNRPTYKIENMLQFILANCMRCLFYSLYQSVLFGKYMYIDVLILTHADNDSDCEL